MLLTNAENISQKRIDKITCDISDIMSQAANSTGMIHSVHKGKPANQEHKGRQSNSSTDKAWMNGESKTKRAIFRRLKRWDKASGG